MAAAMGNIQKLRREKLCVRELEVTMVNKKVTRV